MSRTPNLRRILALMWWSRPKGKASHGMVPNDSLKVACVRHEQNIADVTTGASKTRQVPETIRAKSTSPTHHC